jgi:uncharacterized membrane protein HdeD (DUF308 family)
MESTLARNWWAFVLRGALAMVFALMVVAWSSATPMALARVFGVFAIAEGALAIGSTLGARRDEDRPWPLVLEGAIGIGFGLVGLIAPFASLATVAWVIASWIAIVGMLEGATSLKMHRHVTTPRVMVAVGVVSLIAAAAMVFTPYLGEIVTVYLLGGWAAFLGAATFVVGMVMRRDAHTPLFNDRIDRGTLPSLVPVRMSRPSRPSRRM